MSRPVGGYPRKVSLDSTLQFLRDPYRFIHRTAHREGVDAFTTRLMLRPTTCVTGSAASALFYDERLFQRRGAMPGPIAATLLGQGGVQGLDGERHRERKRLFMSFLTGARAESLVDTVERNWTEAVVQWEGLERVELYSSIQPILARSVCQWAGVPLPVAEIGLRTRQLALLFDGAGAVGLRHWASRHGRREADHWIADLVDDHRAGRLLVEPDSLFAAFSAYREQGETLPSRVVAVEVLNVLRPVVAASVYITFIAHALTVHPVWTGSDAPGGNTPARWFVDEVRRFYPFFPAVAAVTRDEVTIADHWVPAGRRVLLDLYGTNHDPRVWDDPHIFRPGRFAEHLPAQHDLIPQGGGDYQGHRCAGEPLLVRLMETAYDVLAHQISFTVPPQDLSIDFGRLPALPADRMVIAGVRMRERIPFPD